MHLLRFYILVPIASNPNFQAIILNSGWCLIKTSHGDVKLLNVLSFWRCLGKKKKRKKISWIHTLSNSHKTFLQNWTQNCTLFCVRTDCPKKMYSVKRPKQYSCIRCHKFCAVLSDIKVPLERCDEKPVAHLFAWARTFGNGIDTVCTHVCTHGGHKRSNIGRTRQLKSSSGKNFSFPFLQQLPTSINLGPLNLDAHLASEL